MGLSGAVIFPGYLPDEDFSALMEQCVALIFPSLFEGFGMPLVEAMASTRPILCGTGTSLPEVAGDAALFFNAMKPLEIVDAISRLEQDPNLQQELIETGTRRLASLGGPEEMAARYFRVFQEAVDPSSDPPPAITGVFDDGWVGERITIAFGGSVDARDLILTLTIPAWSPVQVVTVRLTLNGEPVESHTLQRGDETVLCQPLPARRGHVELLCSPGFQPKASGMGDDSRFLTCQCQSAEIVSVQGPPVTLAGRTYATS